MKTEKNLRDCSTTTVSLLNLVVALTRHGYRAADTTEIDIHLWERDDREPWGSHLVIHIRPDMEMGGDTISAETDYEYVEMDEIENAIFYFLGEYGSNDIATVDIVFRENVH